MQLALALGARYLGLTWPNPSVGAVIVREDGGGPLIVATGTTQQGGRPHAERVALAAAGERARGATLYVSLEPCSHHGLTPPCAEAIVAAGIARVVSALEDPDARVAGRGHARLRAAGIAVTTGLLAEAAARLHRGHVTRVREGRPFTLLKLAQTADGYAAAGGPGRLLITGEAANARVHLMRAHADAVLVGIETVLADDPLLTVRLPGLERRSPVRVVFDSSLRLPLESKLVDSADAHPVWVVCAPHRSLERDEALRAAGVTVIPVAAAADGRIDLRDAMRALGERGLTRLLCEGGPRLADALARADLVDEVVVATGPENLGRVGVPAIGPALTAALAQTFMSREVEQVGTDRLQIFDRQAA